MLHPEGPFRRGAGHRAVCGACAAGNLDLAHLRCAGFGLRACKVNNFFSITAYGAGYFSSAASDGEAAKGVEQVAVDGFVILDGLDEGHIDDFVVLDADHHVALVVKKCIDRCGAHS